MRAAPITHPTTRPSTSATPTRHSAPSSRLSAKKSGSRATANAMSPSIGHAAASARSAALSSARASRTLTRRASPSSRSSLLSGVHATDSDAALHDGSIARDQSLTVRAIFDDGGTPPLRHLCPSDEIAEAQRARPAEPCARPPRTARRSRSASSHSQMFESAKPDTLRSGSERR